MLSPATIEESIEEALDHKITYLMDYGYISDKFWLKIKAEMTKEIGIPTSKEVALLECQLQDNRLLFWGRLYVPDTELQILLLQTIHNSYEDWHPGKNNMYEMISRYYWWPKLSHNTTHFVANCTNYGRNNVSRSQYQGTLKPLPLPLQHWRDISIDFVGPTYKVDSFNCIMVVVCRLSKEHHYILCHTTMTASKFAEIFLREVWRLHGLPDLLVSDWGPLFISEFWQAVCHRLGVKISLSTAFHPETDGQTEKPMHFLNSTYTNTLITPSLISSSGYQWLNLLPTTQQTPLLRCHPSLPIRGSTLKWLLDLYDRLQSTLLKDWNSPIKMEMTLLQRWKILYKRYVLTSQWQKLSKNSLQIWIDHLHQRTELEMKFTWIHAISQWAGQWRSLIASSLLVESRRCLIPTPTNLSYLSNIHSSITHSIPACYDQKPMTCYQAKPAPLLFQSQSMNQARSYGQLKLFWTLDYQRKALNTRSYGVAIP